MLTVDPNTLIDGQVEIEKEELSDGSHVYNVYGRFDKRLLIFNCVDRRHAERLTRALNDCTGWWDVS